MTDAMEDFLGTGRRSLSTADAIRGWLKRWQTFCATHRLDWRKASEDDVARFQQELLWWKSRHGRLYSPNTVDQALRMLRAFYRWAHTQGFVVHNPTTQLTLPRPPQPEQPTLTRGEVTTLFNLPDLSKPIGQRDVLMLELFYELQLTVRQCLALKLDHLLPDSIELGDYHWDLSSTKPALERYLSDGRERLVRDDTQVLLLTRDGDPVGQVGHLLHRYGQQLGLSYSLNATVLHRSAREHQAQLHRRRFRPDGYSATLGE
jgi:site-specific recombinase XerD